MRPQMTAESNYSVDRRVGRFRIDAELVYRSPQEALAILSGVIVVRCEHRLAERVLDYYGFSEHFEPCEPYTKPPIYEPRVSNPGGGSLHVEWVRLER